jgi:membrane-associated phospholipid phosphatase
MNGGIKPLLYQIRWLFIPYLILLIVCIILKLNFTREDIYFAVNRHNSLFFDYLAPFFTDLGDGWTIIFLSFVLLLFSYRKAFLLLTAYAITSILAQLIKHSVYAARPKLYFKDQLDRIHFIKGTELATLGSFPSGHTVTAFSAAVMLTWFCRDRRWGTVFFVIACLIGYSRMYLSQHFFEDVLAGSAIGFFVTVIWLWWISNKIFINGIKWNQGLLALFKR